MIEKEVDQSWSEVISRSGTGRGVPLRRSAPPNLLSPRASRRHSPGGLFTSGRTPRNVTHRIGHGLGFRTVLVPAARPCRCGCGCGCVPPGGRAPARPRRAGTRLLADARRVIDRDGWEKPTIRRPAVGGQRTSRRPRCLVRHPQRLAGAAPGRTRRPVVYAGLAGRLSAGAAGLRRRTAGTGHGGDAIVPRSLITGRRASSVGVGVGRHEDLIGPGRCAQNETARAPCQSPVRAEDRGCATGGPSWTSRVRASWRRASGSRSAHSAA